MTLYDAVYTESQPRAFTLRGKVLGGSSAVNGAWFLRGLPEDYNAWGSALWDYSELEGIFRRIETDLDFPTRQIHGNDGPIPVQRTSANQLLRHQLAFEEAAIGSGFNEKEDLADPHGQGVGRLPMNKIGGRRISTAMAYVDPVRSRPNLTIWGNCSATRVIIERQTATGVLAELHEQPIRVDTDNVFLTAGSLETPTLLILSGIGPAGVLNRLGIPIKHELAGVGQNLRDHPVVSIELTAGDRFRPEQIDPPHQLLLVDSCPTSSARNDLLIAPSFVFCDTLNYLAVIQKMASMGEIEFVSSAGSIRPRLHYHYLEDEADRRRIREAVRLVVGLLRHPAMRHVGATQFEGNDSNLANDRDLDQWIDRSISSAYHSSGTCKMGPADDPLAVVDDHGRVHGIRGLTLADLSIAPDAVRAPTNATAIMIGERIAELMNSEP